MDPSMDQLNKALIELETEAEELLLARHQMVENDKVRNANREALTALRKRAKTTKSSIPSPFQTIMREMEGSSSRPLVQELCLTCGSHDPKENTWMMFPRSDIFVRVPFHAAHTILDKDGNEKQMSLLICCLYFANCLDQETLDYEMKKLQSYVKEKSFIISEKGALADRVSPGIVRSIVALTDKPQ